jgi:hypothetical protein
MIKSIQMKNPEYLYNFLNRIRNPQFLKGVKSISDRRKFMIGSDSFESCLIHDNSENLKQPELYIKTIPKWITLLNKTLIDPVTGELTPAEKYETNELKQSNYRKLKALNKFCKKYDPLYKKKKFLRYSTLSLG